MQRLVLLAGQRVTLVHGLVQLILGMHLIVNCVYVILVVRHHLRILRQCLFDVLGLLEHLVVIDGRIVIALIDGLYLVVGKSTVA